MGYSLAIALLIASAFMSLLSVLAIVNPSYSFLRQQLIAAFFGAKPGTRISRSSAAVSLFWWAFAGTLMGLITFGIHLESFFVPLAALQLLVFLFTYFVRRKRSN